MTAETRRLLALLKFPPDQDNFIGVTLTCSYYVGPGASQDYCTSRAKSTLEHEAQNLGKYFSSPNIVMGEIESVYEEMPAKYGARIGRMYFRCAIEITEKGTGQ
jgi:hypothetical protein